MTTAEIPGPCPCCGGITLSPATQKSVLLGVCDVLVVRALERVGQKVLRANRGQQRRPQLRQSGVPLHLAYTRWPASMEIAEHAAKSDVWDIVPEVLDVHGCDGVSADEVTAMLRRYVVALAVSGTPHRRSLLRARFESELGLSLRDVPERDRVEALP